MYSEAYFLPARASAFTVVICTNCGSAQNTAGSPSEDKGKKTH